MPFIITACTIISLFTVSQLITISSLENLKKNTDVINLAGRERMLAQQMIKIIAADDLGGETLSNMDSVTKAFYRDHQLLTSYFQPQSGSKANANFLFDYSNLNLLKKSFQNFYDFIISTPDSTNVNENFINLISRQEAYLVQVEHLITAVDNNSQNKVSRFKQIEVIIFSVLILIILAEIIFVFFPVIRKVQNQNEKLRIVAFNQSHVIRQPLSNIKGLLYLLTDIKPNEDEAKKLIMMANTEVEKLDSIIVDNVAMTQ